MSRFDLKFEVVREVKKFRMKWLLTFQLANALQPCLHVRFFAKRLSFHFIIRAACSRARKSEGGLWWFSGRTADRRSNARRATRRLLSLSLTASVIQYRVVILSYVCEKLVFRTSDARTCSIRRSLSALSFFFFPLRATREETRTRTRHEDYYYYNNRIFIYV